MTAQIPERLIHKGEDLALCSTPLSDFFAMAGVTPEFEVTWSTLWRGYIGTWEIVADRLYLIGLEGTLPGGTPASIEAIFPGFRNRVFAHWYSGTLRLPQGHLLEYVHGGYQSTYERDLFMDIERGLVQKSWVQHNEIHDSHVSLDGHAIRETILPAQMAAPKKVDE